MEHKIDFSVLENIHNLAMEQGNKESNNPGPVEKKLTNEGRQVAVYKTYQQNIKIAGDCQRAIMEGMRNGESPYRLCLEACKAIAMLTGDQAFYTTAVENMKKNYGIGVLDRNKMVEGIIEANCRVARLRELKTYATNNGERAAVEKLDYAIDKTVERRQKLENLMDSGK